MCVFLFLYPVDRYVDAMIMKDLDRRPRPYPYGRLNEIIDIRYRKLGYRVSWLFFGKANNPRTPDTDALSPMIKMSPGDCVLCAGVPYAVGSDFRYADVEYVFAQMPRSITDLKVGGFHQGDCVSRLAGAAYKRGISTIVDEDTTEHFFSQIHLGHHIPDSRDYHEEGFGPWRAYAHDPGIIRCRIAAREDKPWFIIPQFVLP